jgi:hypothetical protein
MSPAEEKEFLGVIKRLSFGPFVMHGVEAKRRIADFGLRYVRPTRSLTEAPEFPPELEPCACGQHHWPESHRMHSRGRPRNVRLRNEAYGSAEP